MVKKRLHTPLCTIRSEIIGLFAGVQIAIATALLLSVFFFAGMLLCAASPLTGTLISSVTFPTDDSPYTRHSAFYLASETYSYATCDHRSYGEPSFILASSVLRAANMSIHSPEKSALWSEETQEIVASAQPEGGSYSVFKLCDINPAFSFDIETRNTLDSISEKLPHIWHIATLTLVISMILFALITCIIRSKACGLALIVGGIISLLFLITIGLFGFLNFDQFFSAIHTALFPTISLSHLDNMLLNQLFSREYWIIMFAIWFVWSCIASIAAIIIGRLLNKAQSPPRRTAP